MTSRDRKVSLSSILKAQSPARTALVDINPNLNGPSNDDVTTMDLAEKKKKRRSSRRVSFADTYQVKEFMKDSDRKELGLWDDSEDATTHQELHSTENSENPSGGVGSSDAQQNAAHHIKGFETLLSGPIKQEAHSMNFAGQELQANPLSSVQSTSSVGNLQQYTQDSNLDQRKNDVGETSMKSSFLKSFIAADSGECKGSFLSAFSAPNQSHQLTLGQQQQDAQEEPHNESYKSTFLQAFAPAGPTRTESQAGVPRKSNNEFENTALGMELTNCYSSMEGPSRCVGKEERVGDITRIFGGQGNGFNDDNGMDMTTCIGGFDNLSKTLNRPAAESTRIFTSENTNNMDLTNCQGFGSITNSRSQRTYNQTGNLNFTQVFGKLSESNYAHGPLESTATVLRRIDEAIAGSEGTRVAHSSMDSSRTGHILHHTRDTTRKSIAMEPIQEVSSSTASMLNVTSGERSAVSFDTPHAKEEERELPTCSDNSKGGRPGLASLEHPRVPDTEDTAAMEMTCVIRNAAPVLGSSKKVSSSVHLTGSGEDRTRVFDPAADDSAEMEMTCPIGQSIGQPVVAGSRKRDLPVGFDEDKTRVFNSEDTAAMEMTCAFSQPLIRENQGNDRLKRPPAGLDEDKTKVFNSEDTAAMEMTCVVSGANMSVNSVPNVYKDKITSASTYLPSSEKENFPSGPSTMVPSDLGRSRNADHTIVFNPNADDSAEMEMTCAITQPLVTNSKSINASQRVQKGMDDDKTRVFNSEENAAMEMTCVIGDPHLSAFSVQNMHRSRMSSSEKGGSVANRAMMSSTQGVERNREHTRVFEDGNDMEMTCALNQELISGMQSGGRVSKKTVEINGDKTKVFNFDDDAAMEMTCTMNQPLSIGVSQAKQGPPSLLTEASEDKTRIFNSEDTAAMEMTCAMNQPLSVGIGRAKQGPPRLLTEASEDKTRLFNSEDTAAMEMTCGMNQLLSVGIGRAKQGPPPLLTEASEDKTRIFNSEDTAAMEMTCAINQPLPVGVGRAKQGPPPLLTEACEDKTKIFTAEDTAAMEMTCAMNQPLSIGISRAKQGPPPMLTEASEDKTRLFNSEDTAAMEMTCAMNQPLAITGGKTLQECIELPTESHAEKTRIFNTEDTAAMEMTLMSGTNSSAFSIQKMHPESKMKPSTLAFPSSGEGDTLSGFSHNETKKTEDTTRFENTVCLGSLPEGLAYQLKRKRDRQGLGTLQSDDTAHMEMTECVGELLSDSHTEHRTESREGEMSNSVEKTHNSAADNRDKVQVTECSRETLVDGEGTMQQQEHQDQQVELQQTKDEINNSGDFPHDKTSDTYTLSNPAFQQMDDHEIAEEASQQKPLEGRNSDTFTLNASTLSGSGKRKLGTLLDDKLSRTSSVSSKDGQTMADGEGSSNSPDMESATSFALKDSIILPDWIDAEGEKGILDELPIDHDNTEDLCLTSTKRPRMEESMFTSSHMDASYLTSNLSHLPFETGDSSVEDFLQMFFKFNDLPIGKRSIMCPPKVSEPSTLSNRLENACIIKPKADMYEWAIKFLTPAVEELRMSMKSHQAKCLEGNVQIVKEMQSASPQRRAEIMKRGSSLQKYCKASSKAKMNEWRLKMVNNTKATMEDSCQQLERNIAKLTNSISTIEEQLQNLAAVDSALDDAINSLEKVKLPTDTEKAEWIANSQQLASMQTQLDEREQEVQKVESERQRLEAEIQNLEETTSRLEVEKEELSRLTTGPSQVVLEIEDMKSEIALLHSFQEWRLQALDETSYEFSFLSKSVCLDVEYDNTESGAKLKDLSLYSVLADDACVSAKLAHSLFFSSICAEKLKTLYPTRGHLSQMMQHLSELIGQVRLLEAEVSRIDFWHPLTTQQNRLSVEFSSIEAHSKFHVHLDIPPGQYPFTLIPHSCTIKIGKISESTINATIEAVQPGWKYIPRIVKAIDQLIEKHS